MGWGEGRLWRGQGLHGGRSLRVAAWLWDVPGTLGGALPT